MVSKKQPSASGEAPAVLKTVKKHARRILGRPAAVDLAAAIAVQALRNAPADRQTIPVRS